MPALSFFSVFFLLKIFRGQSYRDVFEK